MLGDGSGLFRVPGIFRTGYGISRFVGHSVYGTGILRSR